MIVCSPLVLLFIVAVRFAVIACRVMRATVRHSFHDNRSLLFYANIARFFARNIRCKQVIAIKAIRIHSISICSGRNAITSILIRGRCRYRVSIVSTHPYNRCLGGGTKVKRGMCIAFRCGTVTKIANGTRAFSFAFDRICCACCLRHLRCQCTRDGHTVQFFAAIMDRHLFAFRVVIVVTKANIGALLQRETSLYKRAQFTILKEEHIVRLPCFGAAHLQCFLA
mmetsp:Transcript_31894/g.51606  ORF Transcript_31894/g.51606 Transcript_31894/m.51606 type:complete len:225 (+) Transcript_31894:400-1074(+)